LKYFTTILFIFPCLCFAQLDEGFTGYETGRMLSETRDALLSYELVQEKTNFLSQKLEKMLLGGYTEKFLIFAPLITGKVEFRALDVNFYVDTRSSRGGVNYTYNF
jgi:hypothetical protein